MCQKSVCDQPLSESYRKSWWNFNAVHIFCNFTSYSSSLLFEDTPHPPAHQLLFWIVVVASFLEAWREHQCNTVLFLDDGDAETRRWRRSVCCILTLNLCLLSVWCACWLDVSALIVWISPPLYSFFIPPSLPAVTHLTILFVTCSVCLPCLIWPIQLFHHL